MGYYDHSDDNPRSERDSKRRKRVALIVGGVLGAILLLVVISLVFGAFGFIMQKVETHEVGLITKAGRPTELVGPNVYSRWGPFSYYDLQLIDTSAKEFCAEDNEVLTTSENEENPIRIGVKVCGTLFRPGLEIGFDEFSRRFIKYRDMYTNDDPVIGYTKDGVLVEGLIQAKTQQAMKSCIGEGTFFDAAVGQARDATALCHEDALNALLRQYGFTVANVTVPNITIPATVGEALDTVAKAKFDAEAERELAGLARAKAAREQAEKEGAIRVAQSETQERLRQNIETAELEEASTLAQLAVIEATKANDLRVQVLDLGIAEAAFDVALQNAEIALAQESVLVNLYSDNPAYLDYLVNLANAEAFGETDKLILPAGTIPKTVISPDGDVATVISPEE